MQRLLVYQSLWAMERRRPDGLEWSLEDKLEMIRGELWCNIYQTSRIAVINPDTGQVTKWVDLAGIAGPDGKGMKPVQPEATADWVLNGIAYDAQGDRLFVTGKNWPSIFEIKVKPQPTTGS